MRHTAFRPVRRGGDARRAALRRPGRAGRRAHAHAAGAAARRPPAAAGRRRRRSARASGSANGSTAWSRWRAATASRPPRGARSPTGRPRCSAWDSRCAAVPMSQGTPFANVLLVCDLERRDLTVKPAPITAFTLVTALGHGHAAHARRAARRHAPGCARRPSRLRRSTPGSAWSTASTSNACRRRWRASTAATTASRHWRCAATASMNACGARRHATARGASACCSAPAPRASCRPRSPTASATADGALPAGFHYAETHNTSLGRRFVRPRSGSRARRGSSPPPARRAPRSSPPRPD